MTDHARGQRLSGFKIASREAILALEAYEEILLTWQKRINLVGDSTLSDLWQRHFIDSYQLVSIIDDLNRNKLLHVKQNTLKEKNASREAIMIADLGSGAGFPGLVLAIAGFHVHLIESDQRKCAFLREAARLTLEQIALREAIRPTIHNQRIENTVLKADLITSRAFADLAKTLEVSEGLCHEDTRYLLLKPLDIEKELTEATKYWYFKHQILPSATDSRGCILHLSQISKK